MTHLYSKRHFSRRDILKATLVPLLAYPQGGLPFAMGQSTQHARSSERSSKYLILCYFEGGWDLLLGLDPRDANTFNDQNLADTLIQPAYHLLPPQFSRNQVNAGPFFLGPCATSLVPFADQFTLLRGIDMGTLTHEVGRRYLITGQPPIGLSARGSSLSSIVANHLGDLTPIPHLSHHVENYNDRYPAFASALNIGAVDQLKYLLKDQLGIPNSLPPQIKGALVDLQTQQLRYAQRLANHPESMPMQIADQDWAQKEIYKYLESRTKVRDLINAHLADSFDFASPAQSQISAHYRLGIEGLESPYGRAALCAQAIKKNLSKVVTVSLSEGLDTHDQSWANLHADRLFKGFDALSLLLQDLSQTEAPEGGSLLSQSLVVAFSEFSRTPLLNIRNGRDHHFTNSLLMVGSSLKKGVFGQSTDRGMAPQKINDVGLPDAMGKALRPGDIAKTILSTMGLPQVEVDQNITVGDVLAIKI